MNARAARAACWIVSLGWGFTTLAEIFVSTEGLEDPLRSTIEKKLADIRVKAVSHDSESYANALGDLGKTLQAHGLYESAIEAFSRAYDVDTRPAWIYYRAIASNEIGLMEEALKDLETVVEKDPSNALMWFRYGEALYIDGQVERAEQSLLNALELKPDHAAALVRLADIRRLQSKLDEALELLMRAWEVDSTAGQTAFRIAQVHRQLGNDEEAQVWFARRNERAPLIDDPLLREVSQYSLNPSFFKSAGRRAWAREEFGEAINAYEIAMNMGATDEDTMLDYANMRLIAKRHGGLEAFLSEVMRRYPESARAWFLYGQALAVKQPTKATTALRKSLAITSDTRVEVWLANHLMRQKVFDEARDTFRQLVESNPSNAYYRFWLALALHRTGECDLALEQLNKLSDIEPTWGEAHVLRTRTHALCGDRKLALFDANRLLNSNNSTDTRLTKRLAEIANGIWENNEENDVDLDHPDFSMLSEAVDSRSLPELPFHENSTWWTPK